MSIKQKVMIFNANGLKKRYIYSDVLTNIAQLVFLLEELDVENLSELLSRLNSGYILQI